MKRIAVVSDFDGTITTRDVQNAILEEYARPDWREVERKIIRGGGKSLAYLPAVYEGCTATEEAVLDFVDREATMDPTFPDFCEFVEKKGWMLLVVSDGLGLYIRRVMSAHSLSHVPYYSNEAHFTRDGVRLLFPYLGGCGKCGNCKREKVEALRSRGIGTVVYVGDGISDQCAAGEADLVFAKKDLAYFCEEHSIPHVTFTSFGDVQESIDEDLEKLGIPTPR